MKNLPSRRCPRSEQIVDRSSGQFVPVRPSSLSKNDAQYEKKRKGVEVAQKMYVCLSTLVLLS